MNELAPRGVLFLDQSGAMGGAELSMLDLLCQRRSAGEEGDRVVLLAEGPFADRLRSAGIPVEVLTLAVGVQKNSGVSSVLRAMPRVWAVARHLARLNRKHSVVYANTQKAAIVGAISAWLARRPFVWHLRDMLDAEHFSSANRHAVITLTNRVASRVIANSRATAEAYHAAGGTVNTATVHNGIDAATFDVAIGPGIDSLRKSITPETDAYLIGAFGRLTPWKGQHVLLEAAQQLEDPRIHVVIVGEALFTEEDRSYAEELRHRYREGVLRGRVHWLGQRDDVPKLMQAVDAVIHCSTAPEPFGRVIVEGMLAERPLIASNAGGAAEIIEHEKTGLLTELGSVEALAAGIKRFLDNPDEARRMAVAGRQDALFRFNIDDRVADINAIIEQVARGN